MGGFIGGILGGESESQKREKRELRERQASIDEANKKRKKQLAEEALVSQAKARKKISTTSARRSVITSPLGIVDDALA